MKFNLGPEIVLSYKRLSYTPWYALAEFVDNSTQAYFTNQAQLDPLFKAANEKLTVDILSTTEFLQIKDNSIGMDATELQSAIILGRPPVDTSGRSQYGLGLKTAAFWFGNKVTITTKKLGSPKQIEITMFVDDIAGGNFDVEPVEVDKPLDEHYTIILIEDLNRQIIYRSKSKVKDYLTTFYRKDLSEEILKLTFNGEDLTWDYKKQIFSKLRKFRTGELGYKEFSFDIEGRTVNGWAGVLQRGSRALAGFSLLQSNRVIQSSFKTPSIFGQQEGGSNNLVNQRLLGELEVDGFDISHTKDEILFSDEEYNELDKKLALELEGLVNLALTSKEELSPQDSDRDKFSKLAMSALESEIVSREFLDAYTYDIGMPEDAIERSKQAYINRLKKLFQPSREFNVGGIKVILYLVSDQSIYDPYLSIESASDKQLIIVVNQSHPYWDQLDSVPVVLDFLRHCVYDGLAEWKCMNQYGRINSDTAKLFKDRFLRIPFEMDKNSRPAPQEGEEEVEADA